MNKSWYRDRRTKLSKRPEEQYRNAADMVKSGNGFGMKQHHKKTGRRKRDFSDCCYNRSAVLSHLEHALPRWPVFLLIAFELVLSCPRKTSPRRLITGFRAKECFAVLCVYSFCNFFTSDSSAASTWTGIFLKKNTHTVTIQKRIDIPRLYWLRLCVRGLKRELSY